MMTTPDFEASCALLREIDVAIDEALSTPQAFGSWFIRGTAKGKKFRVVWDGRDRALIVQAPSLSGASEDWVDSRVAGEGYARKFIELRDGVLAVLDNQPQS